jgi:hypothetical protein
MAINTAFSPNPDLVAQVTGSGQPAPGAGSTGLAPTYASSIELAPTLQFSRFIAINTTSAVGNATLTAAYVPQAGARLVIQINNDASAARTITFSTGFRTTGTVVGTASKAIVVTFCSDGTTFNEASRTTALT